MPINKIKRYLDEIEEHRTIDTIDLYGGEPLLLPKGYLNDELIPLLMQYSGNIQLVTNLSSIKPVLFFPFIKLFVSYDGPAREKHELVLKYLTRLDIHNITYGILTLVSPKVIEYGPKALFEDIKHLKGLTSIEFKPYSINQHNQLNTQYTDFEEYVFEAIRLAKQYNIHCVNETHLQQVLTKERNAFSDDHIYITPNGFSVLDFDLNDQEYFLHLDTFNDYLKWTQQEKQKVKSNSICQHCQYLGHCLSEHLREVKDLNHSCNGYYHLIERYKGM